MSKIIQDSRMKAALDLLLEGDVDLSNALGQAAMGYGMYKGGYFGPTSVTPGGGSNLQALNYMGPQYGNLG